MSETLYNSPFRVPMPNPTDAELHDPIFEAIWQCIKTWDVNVPSHYTGYCGASGSHAKLILDALRPVRDGRDKLIAALTRDAGQFLFEKRVAETASDMALSLMTAAEKERDIARALRVRSHWRWRRVARDLRAQREKARLLHAQALKVGADTLVALNEARESRVAARREQIEAEQALDEGRKRIAKLEAVVEAARHLERLYDDETLQEFEVESERRHDALLAALKALDVCTGCAGCPDCKGIVSDLPAGERP